MTAEVEEAEERGHGDRFVLPAFTVAVGLVTSAFAVTLGLPWRARQRRASGQPCEYCPTAGAQRVPSRHRWSVNCVA
jgi:hypothetical protein